MAGPTLRQRLALALAVAVVTLFWRTPCDVRIGPSGRVLISTR